MTPPRITPAATLPSHRHTPDWIDVNITSNNLRDKPTLFAYDREQDGYGTSRYGG